MIERNSHQKACFLYADNDLAFLHTKLFSSIITNPHLKEFFNGWSGKEYTTVYLLLHIINSRLMMHIVKYDFEKHHPSNSDVLILYYEFPALSARILQVIPCTKIHKRYIVYKMPAHTPHRQSILSVIPVQIHRPKPLH